MTTPRTASTTDARKRLAEQTADAASAASDSLQVGPDVASVLAGVLGLHRKECSSEYCAACDCGWDMQAADADALEHEWMAFDAHEAHVASALAAAIEARP